LRVELDQVQPWLKIPGLLDVGAFAYDEQREQWALEIGPQVNDLRYGLAPLVLKGAADMVLDFP
jgi:hypothetical protein